MLLKLILFLPVTNDFEFSSVTVITRDANSKLDDYHDRMPAVLPTQKAVDAWLNPKTKGEAALERLTPLKDFDVEVIAVNPDEVNDAGNSKPTWSKFKWAVAEEDDS